MVSTCKKIVFCIVGATAIAIAVVVPIEVIKNRHPSDSSASTPQTDPAGGGQSGPSPDSGSTPPNPSSQGGNSGNLPHTGDMTYYSTGLGACGRTDTDTDNICAISHVLYDAANNSPNPNTNPLCGRTISVSHHDSVTGQEKSLTLTVVDRCEACKQWDIDLSPGAFGRLEGDRGLGRVSVRWGWA